MLREPDVDIVVVGAGHAACEAALASARLGRRVAVVTISLGHVAEMACNPSIGGLAKGQLVREIDALGGEMGRAIDDTGIQFRMLNTGKGAAVRSLRAQADRVAYHQRMLQALRSTPGISVEEGRVEGLLVEGGKVNGVYLTQGRRVTAGAVVLTTGTFLCGKLYVGSRVWAGGRTGERAASHLSESLLALGLPLRRLKTGTPPRLRSSSIEWSRLEAQRGDEPPSRFSHSGQVLEVDQVACHLTCTSRRTHAVIRGALDRSPLFSGKIEGIGPRYCPSIEDKVVRFEARDSHRVVLEPETRRGEVTYPNGLSTSLPFDVQVEMIRSIEGLERAELTQPGYAVEYDCVDPTVLDHTLRVRDAEGLYLAGQINGTSGYEEAAAQGLVAGINAALELGGGGRMVLSRDQAYIGVLVDDLVTKGADEPYRMFTSRAEHRLVLRHDNADLRLTSLGHELGLVGDEQMERTRLKAEAVQGELKRLRRVTPPLDDAARMLSERGAGELSQAVPAERVLARPGVSLADVHRLAPPPRELPEGAAATVEVEVKYRGYIERARELVRRQARLEEKPIPDWVEYHSVRGLSTEASQKLARIRPETVGQAGRIPGVSPADVGVLLIHMRLRGAERDGEDGQERPGAAH